MESTLDGQWGVIDRNAREKPRIHEPVPGRRYALTDAKATLMPREHAVVFLRDPSFVVYDENGEVVPTLPSVEASGERKFTELDAGECVARYDELTSTALLARAMIRPGGSRFTATTPREILVGFLLQAPRVADEAPERKARDVTLSAEATEAGAAFAASLGVDPLAALQVG